jgi:putative membrane protein
MSRQPLDRVREHQANERTFLAWLRTSIALTSFGFAIARFGLFLRQIGAVVSSKTSVQTSIFNSENLGTIMVIVGIVAIALAAWRYSQVFWQIEREDYQPSRITVFVMTAIVIILGILTIPILLIRDREIIAPASPTKNLNSNR